MKQTLMAVFLSASLTGSFAATEASAADDYDFTKDKVLEVVATAHLDTQWRWTIQKTIDEYILNTMRRNFVLFETYPNYTFSFEGAFRYMLMKEYYPRDYAKLTDYIAKNRWALCGSSIDAGDVNIPSPEAIMRNIMYGQRYFRQEFGKTSTDIYLPDCFGFGYALPSISRHCGLKGFSSQKLTWGSSVGIPFDVGVWEGVDGSQVVAALNPDPYVSTIRSDLSTNQRWIDTIEKQGKESGLFVGYKYFGVGDVGGAPDDESVSWLEKSMKGNGPLKVVSVPADKLYHEITPAMMKKLPYYKGELLMTTHGSGCYTSQNAMKRWNRRNEQLVDAVERASVAASWLNGITYPAEAIRENWIRFIWHQFHDDLTGTSIPEAYEFSWNDELICLNRSASMLTDAVGAVSRSLDTRAEGQPVVVYNPLAIERTDTVEASVVFPGTVPAIVRVFDANGKEIPAQTTGVHGSTVTVLFVAKVDPVSFTVFDVRPSSTPCALPSELTATESGISNERYMVKFDANGDISSITDKKNGKELLKSPVRLALFQNNSKVWPAWEITYETVTAQPVGYVDNPVSVRVIEKGPARAAVEILRKAGDTTVIQTVSLAAGSDRLIFDNIIDWRSKERLLKAVFPFAVSNEKAAYDLGLGVIERGNNTEKMYEVPAQQWADITDANGSYGVTVMNDCLYGWDKPSDNTLRLTMLHTPNSGGYTDQAMQDIGRHRMSFAIAGHAGSWKDGSTAVHEASRMNQPLVAFQAKAHEGPLGKSLSFVKVSTPQLTVKALKMAEDGDEIVIRLIETEGKALNGAEITFAKPVTTAREINGMEDPVGEAMVRNGKLVADFTPFQPKTFAVKIGYPAVALSKPSALPVEIAYNIDAVSFDGDRSDGDMDGNGHTYVGEQLPKVLTIEGIPFKIGPTADGMNNALACKGQTFRLPEKPRMNGYNRLYILAAASNGDTKGTFAVGETKTTLGIQNYTGFIGQWDNRLVNGNQVHNVFQVLPSFIKRDRVAYVGTHRHSVKEGNESYIYTYLFLYTLDIPEGAATVTLPDNENIRVFAITAAVNDNDAVIPAQLLYDEAKSTSVSLDVDTKGFFIDSMSLGLKAQPENAEIHYTLDGSEPTKQSPRYTGQRFTITEATTIKAKAFAEGIDDVRMLEIALKKATLRPAVTASGLKPGLTYSLYHGKWDNLPDFKKLKPVSSGIIDTFRIPEGTREDNFALTWTGYIEIPTNGIYAFSTKSDDGSRMLIDGEMVIDNDGLHGPQEMDISLALAKGPHAITVQFFEQGGGESIDVYYSGPDIAKRPINVEVLKHK